MGPSTAYAFYLVGFHKTVLTLATGICGLLCRFCVGFVKWKSGEGATFLGFVKLADLPAARATNVAARATLAALGAR